MRLLLTICLFLSVEVILGQDTNQFFIKDGFVLKLYSEPEKSTSVPFDYLFFEKMPEISKESTEFQLLDNGYYINWISLINNDLLKLNTGFGYSLFVGKQNINFKKKLKNDINLEFYPVTIVYQINEGRLSSFTNWETSGSYSMFKNYNCDSLYNVIDPELIIWR